MRFRSSLFVAAALSLAAPVAALAATAQQVLETEVQTQDSNAVSQQRVDKLSDDSRKALEAYRAALYKAQQLKLYAKELDEQVAGQAGERESLSRQLAEVARTQEDIVPLMLRMVDTLEKFVALDKPFLLDERKERLTKLRAALRDSQLGVGEQFRRVLEAYQVETEYGHTLETWRGDLRFGDELRAVDFLMLGRVSLYYLSIDGEQGAWWDPAQKKWVELSGHYNHDVRHAIRMANEGSAPELLRLPISAPAPATAPVTVQRDKP
ncbi:MAG: DUF3450 domain-containing protein [Nevskiales bacterium]